MHQTQSEINAALKKCPCIEAIGSVKVQADWLGQVLVQCCSCERGCPLSVGWVAAGWIAMFGGEQGAELGGNLAEDLNKNC